LLTSCLLLLEEYGVTFEYLPGNKQKNVGFIVDALSCLDIDSLKIQEEELLTLRSVSENNSIINIKFPIYTAFIFKEQAKLKRPHVLSHFYIDFLKIQETLFSGSEDNSISNIKSKLPMHTTLIFKEQAKVKNVGLREKGLAQPHYSRQHIEGYDLLCYIGNKEDLHSSTIETRNKEYCSGTMNIYFIQDRLDQKRLSGIP
jgi:hypothetical protein